MKTHLTIVAMLVFLARPAAAVAREWTDSTEKYWVEAEFVDVQGETVRLKKQDGSIVTVPISRLSTQDQRWVKQRTLRAAHSRESSHGGQSLMARSGATQEEAGRGGPAQEVIEVRASKAAVDVWRQWNGKHAIFVHREAQVRNVTDLAEKRLLCALIDAGWEIVADAQQFLKAAGVKMTIAIQNNPNVYAGQLLEGKESSVGFMVAGVANTLKLSAEQRLIRVTFVESPEDNGQGQTRPAATAGAKTVAPGASGRNEAPAADVADQRSTSQWPSLSGDVSGSNPVRIKNPNGYSVKVGLRCGANGKDFSVAAQDSTTVYVRDGRYDIYFQYSDDPEALYQGDSFTLSGHGAEIQLVKVANGNYGIRRVK